VKEIVERFKFLVAALLFFSIAVALEKSELQPTGYEIGVKDFEKVLHDKQQKLINILDSFAIKVKKKDFFTHTKSYIFNINVQELQLNDFAILFYDKDTLRYWSDNSIKVDTNFASKALKYHFKDLNNAWYVIQCKQLDNSLIIGLIKIKNKYSFQNKYLDASFQPDFNLSATTRVSPIPLSYGYDVQDIEHNYILSLIPTNTFVLQNSYSNILGIIYLIGIVLLFIYFQQLINQLFSNKLGAVWTILILIAVTCLRYYMQENKLPLNMYSLKFFDPQYFAAILLPSLGDFFINVVYINFLVFNIIKLIQFEKLLVRIKHIYSKYLFVITGLVLSLFLFILIQILFKNLILDSSISFEVYKILNLNIFSLICYLIIAMLFAIFIYFTQVVIKHSLQLVSFAAFIKLSIPVILLCSFFFFNNSVYPAFFSTLFYITIIWSIGFINKKELKRPFYTLLFLNFLVTVYSIAFITYFIEHKNDDISKVLITRLTNERDAVAELLIKDIDKNLVNDEALVNYFHNNAPDLKQKIYWHLQKKYFQGFWSKYDLTVNVERLVSDSAAFYQNSELESEYDLMVEKNGVKINNTDYYFLENQNNTISYSSKLKLRIDTGKVIGKIFIKLDSKLITQEIGYPDLLLDEKDAKVSPFADYSYAKFKNHILAKKNGAYIYDLSDIAFGGSHDEFYFVYLNDYKHLVYLIDDKNSIVLSRQVFSIFDVLISFSYLFVFFNLIIVLFLLVYSRPWKNLKYEFNFKNKLLFSMIIILLLSFFLVGGGTVYYNIRQFEQKHNQNIIEKTQSVLNELSIFIGNEIQLTSSWQSNSYGNLDEFLTEISRVFFSDINLYDLNGELIGSSRNEIFKRGLIGTKMNPEALKQIVVNKKNIFIHDEKIGDLSYSSAYLPFNSNDGKALAYINLPFFTKPSLLREEISTLLVAMTNLYVVLFIVAIIIAVVMSSKITQPLRLIQDKFQHIELGTRYEQIEYHGNDEIGSLVKEYNRMVVKLAESIDLLAKSERESAWREMAKQIAHEIKNPLTPMKLSIQYLIRSWENKDANFESKLVGVTKTLIDQIDTLTAIASEFSAFAKMPKPNEEVIDLVEKIENIVKLFENTDNVKIYSQLNKIHQANIFADKEQISRVFINLLKNAIQSIPDGVNGKIQVEMNIVNNYINIKIEDNGIGISEEQKAKMFTPSFTTKSSGMGLGLPIVKNIITNAKGKIWFESELGKGTKFFVEFPVSEA